MPFGMAKGCSCLLAAKAGTAKLACHRDRAQEEAQLQPYPTHPLDRNRPNATGVGFFMGLLVY